MSELDDLLSQIPMDQLAQQSVWTSRRLSAPRGRRCLLSSPG
jgi:hypothetical protein